MFKKTNKKLTLVTTSGVTSKKNNKFYLCILYIYVYFIYFCYKFIYIELHWTLEDTIQKYF